MNSGSPSYSIDGAVHAFVDVGGATLSVFSAAPSAGASRACPPLLLLHGFPELAYSWRHQIPALAAAGYRVIAPDQRGYADSSCPAEVSDYDIHRLTDDLVGLLDAWDLDSAIVVGHDWGGLVGWQMPLLHPERVAGAVGVNTPFMARLPSPPIEVFRAALGEDNYIVRFQEPEVPDRMLAEDPEGFFRMIFPTDPPVPEVELAVYVEVFTRTGFTGGINWYRNMDRNWETTPEQQGARITGIPCLMVTAEKDPFLPPALAAGMPDLVDDLTMHEFAGCGHWTQQERPEELNAVLIDWLRAKFA